MGTSAAQEPGTDASLHPGTLIAGRYRVDRLVAQGGFGSVYAGHHLVLDAPIAIKVLRQDRSLPSDRARHVAAFLDEARTLARLRHPNIVSVLDAGVLPDTSLPWMALEWCEGSTFKAALTRSASAAPMRPRAAWRYLRPVVVAIAHAHEQGIAHRDLKPSNVMLVSQGSELVPRVLDFGLAKEAAASPAPSGDTSTREPAAFTAAYAAPEQVTCSRTGPWTDVHAIGLLFVELVTGRAPYGELNALEAAVDPERPTPRARGVEVGDALEAVLRRALALKAAGRYATAGELLAAFDQAFEASEATGDEPFVARPAEVRPATSQPPGPSTETLSQTGATAAARPRRWSSWLVAIPLIAVLSGALIAVVSRTSSTPTVAPVEELAAGGTSWSVQEGTWRVEEGALIGSGGQVISSAELRDGRLEVEFESLDDDTHSVGIGFRAQPNDDREDGSGYGANFRLGGDLFNVFEGEHGDWTPVDPAFPNYHPSPAVNPRKNHVVIEAAGSKFDIQVNGQPLASFEDPTYRTGHVTLWVQSSKQTVRFSRIQIASR